MSLWSEAERYREETAVTTFDERHYPDGGRAVTVSVRFDADTDGLFCKKAFLARYCVLLEESVRARSDALKQEGFLLKGTMDYRHLYRELRYHHLAYRYLPSKGVFRRIRNKCIHADLNFDERRLLSLPMYLLSVPKKPEPTEREP